MEETKVEANFLLNPAAVAHSNGSAPQIKVIQEPELRGQGALRMHLARLAIKSSRGPQFIDITDQVQELLTQTGVREGQVLVYSRHTTAGIVINENEPLLIQDMYGFLERLASPTDEYAHNDFSIRTVNMCDDECANGHAHCQHLTVGCSAAVPVMEGRLALGQWQRVFLLEMDRPRAREVIVQVIGV